MRAVTLWLRCSVSVAAGASAVKAAEVAPAHSATPTCSAGAKGDTPAAPPSPLPPSPPTKGAGKKTGPSKALWRTFTFKAWQLHTVEDAAARATMPKTVLYHGEQLGPRPLVILDHSVPASESASAVTNACVEASKKFGAMVSSLGWDHGAVYIPLPVSVGEANTMEQSCRQVCAVLDALNVQWSHVLSHSYGALVAARMAASTAYPHRIGTVLLLDTPLVTEQLVRNMRQREDIAKAKEDVNVPPAELSFAIETLRNDLESTLPYPATADKALYESYLFCPESTFREEGLVRDEHRYVPVRHLAQVHHPLQLLVPAKEPVTDVTVHKEFFALRRPAVIKSAENHEDLFSTKCAGEVADVVRAWMQRFEQDVVLKRRFEQAAKEMTQLMGSTAPSEKSEEAGEKKTEKKEKKKKGKQ
jgi:pimeloyl-ACP methyl ester carboxylesterase